MMVDYIIIGQGISGTFLSYYLHKAGKKILVIDEAKPYTASKVASGVINPVTGRRLVRTWMIDELMPFAKTAYQQLEKELNVPLIKQCDILDFHPTPQMQMAFDERLREDDEYLQYENNSEQWRTYFNYPFGIGKINPCWLVDINTLLIEWRKKLKAENLLLEEKFNVNEIENIIKNNTVVFCDGVAGTNNPYFNLLPYAANKGEALIVKIKDLPHTNIYKQGINIVPWKEDLFWIGSSYEWNYSNPFPSEIFLKKTELQLQQWLKLPYKIIEHIASERPANLERRPFVGLHPLHKNIGVFNGMGTKGCSLAPYFAKEFAEHLSNGSPINPFADVQRFSKILSR